MNAEVIKAKSITPITNGVLEITRFLTNQTTFSVSEVKVKGENRHVKNITCNTAYYVLNGNGRFTIDNQEIEVHTGDLIFIPRETPYQDKGHMTLLNICQPPFSPDQVEFLD